MVETAQYDPIVVEQKLTDDKIRELVERGQESAKLDYKETYDPSDTEQRVKLAKHVLAMSNTLGGYLVIGISDSGARVGLTTAVSNQLDEAIIRAQVQSYTEVPLRIFVAQGVEFEGDLYAIVTVLPVDDQIVVAKTDGAFHRSNRSQGLLFRRGDVLVRHGSSSEPWNQRDAEYITARIARQLKEQWLDEFARDFGGVVSRLGGGPGTPEISSAVFDLSREDFVDLIYRLLRQGNG